MITVQEFINFVKNNKIDKDMELRCDGGEAFKIAHVNQVVEDDPVEVGCKGHLTEDEFIDIR